MLTGANRHSEINKKIPGITEKMLTQQLRELEEDRIVKRKIYPEVPHRVEYSFTELGEELTKILFELEIWGGAFLNSNQRNRGGDQGEYQLLYLSKYTGVTG